MLKRYFIVAIAAVFTLVACAEKFDEQGVLPAGSDKVHTLSVGIEAGDYVLADGVTKASMEPTVRVKWEKYDSVSVINATKGKILGGCLQATEGGTSVVFEGTVTGTIAENDVLYYIYPRLADNTAEIAFDDAGYNQSLANQTYDNDNPLKVCFYGYAEDKATTTPGTGGISKKIQFNLVTSYVHLNMANLPAKGFNLSSIDISNVNKGFKWSLSDATLTAEAFGENEGISVNCKNTKITKSGNAVVHFAIPASAAAPSRVLTVNKAYNNANYAKDKREASTYYNQLYTSWTNENVSVNSAAGDKTDVTINNLGSTETAEGILPVASSGESAFAENKPTEIKLGGLGTITFNQQASAAIKTNTQKAQSTNVFFKVEDVTQTKPVQDANLVYEITMKTVDGNGTEVFSKDNAGAESEATVVIELGQSVSSVQSVSLVDENGNPITGNAVKNVNFDPQTGKLTFTVVHFSKYAIKYTEKQTPVSGYVAQIGGRKYETLASAIAAAQNGNTIQMIANHEILGNAGVTIEKNQNIILDLAGYTVKNLVNESKASQIITNKGTLKIIGNGTLTNTLAEGTIAGDWPTYNYVTNLITNYGTLTIENGTFANTQDSGITYALDNNSNGVDAVATINGGKFTSVGNSAVRMFCNSTTAANTLTINGGYFEGYYFAVAVQNPNTSDNCGTLTINGGEFESKDEIKGYNACIANRTPKSSNISVNIAGGKFNDYVLIASKASVTGGLFRHTTYTYPGDTNESKLADYVADGYELVDNQDAGYPYKVQQKPFVAKIGETGYFSFANAVDAVQANQTIEVLSDIALDSPITISKSGITIDGKGKTIAVSDAEYWNQYKVNGANQGLGKRNMISVSADNFTLKNVTLNGKDCRGVSLCTTTGGKNVLYQNVTYTGRGSGHYYGEATGLVTFDGCKFDTHGYAIHFGGESSLDDDVVIKNCEVNGWSSFGKCKSLTISDSHFGGAEDKDKNGWLAVLRPYCPTTITNCTFSDIYLHTVQDGDGYYKELGLGTGAATTVILNGCKVVDNNKQEEAGVDIYSIVHEAAFDNDTAKQGSVFAFDAEGNAADGFKSGTFYAVTPANIKLQSGYEYYAIEGKTNIYGIREKVVADQTEFETACTAAKSGDKIVLGNGQFAIGPVDINGKTLTFKGQGAANTKIFIGNGGYDGNGGHGSNKTANMTFEDVTLDDLASDAGYLTGFTEAAGLTFRNVTFNIGFSNWGNKGGDVSFFNCTFNQNTAEKYNVQELRSANNTHYLFDGCTFNSVPGRFINAYKQGGADASIEIIVKDCSFIGTNQSKAAVNLKSNLSDGCVITLYLLGNNTTTNVANGSKTGNSLFDDNGTYATVYQGADKNSALTIWASGAKVE